MPVQTQLKQIGFVGGGRMGRGMQEVVNRDSAHEAFVYDRDPSVPRDAGSLEELVSMLQAPRIVWVMVPHGRVTEVVAELCELLSPGDIVVDGANGKASEAPKHEQMLAAKGIDFAVVGVSGGVKGPDDGYALMAGGSDEVIERLMWVINELKPDGPDGFIHAGPIGAGMHVKTIHNGIEYGLMKAYAEGYALLWALYRTGRMTAHPDDVFRSWRAGTVIRSNLLNLGCDAMGKDRGLEHMGDEVQSSGMGRWAVEMGLELDVPTPVISAAVMHRLMTCDVFGDTEHLLNGFREEFGGHISAAKAAAA